VESRCRNSFSYHRSNFYYDVDADVLRDFRENGDFRCMLRGVSPYNHGEDDDFLQHLQSSS